MGRLGVYLMALRAPFFTAAILPAAIGTAMAWAALGAFSLYRFALVLLGTVMLHGGANVINDYFDYRSGCDVSNKNKNPPFSGGSPFLIDGRLSPRAVLSYALLLFALGGMCGMLIVADMGWGRGWVAIAIGVAGGLLGLLYVEPHVNLCGRGAGELAIGLAFGPLLTLGAYYVQAGSPSAWAALAGVPMGFLIAAIIYINQFPDHDADKAAGKRNIVVRFGRDRAVWGYRVIVCCVYLSIALLVAAGWTIGRSLWLWEGSAGLPALALCALTAIPLSTQSLEVLKMHRNEPALLVPGQARAIQAHALVGAMLILSLVIPALLARV